MRAIKNFKVNKINLYGEDVNEKKIQFDTTVDIFQAEILILIISILTFIFAVMHLIVSLYFA